MQVGDEVRWTHVRQSRRTVSMKLRGGVIISIKGEVATVKKASGRTEKVALVRLRTREQKSQITEFVEAVVEAARND